MQTCLQVAMSQDGSTMSTPGPKMLVSKKKILDHFECQSKWSQPNLSLFGLVMAHQRSQKALKMGQFGAKDWSEMAKACLSKNDSR